MADAALEAIMSGFAQEAEELCAKLTHELLNLERAAGAEAAEAYVRVARGLHTLKGTAATVGLEELSNLAHKMEDVLTPHRVTGEALPGPITDAMLKALDLFLTTVRSAAAGKPMVPSIVAEVRGALEVLAPDPFAPTPIPAALPAAAPMPADVPQEPEPAAEVRLDDSWRVSVRDVMALMREVERLRELRLRLVQRRRELDAAVALLKPVAGAGAAADKLATLQRSLAVDAEEAEDIVVVTEGELKAIGTIPIRTIIDPLRRAVRTLSKQLGKEARLTVVGGDVALDRRILEALRGPLMHLVRNSVDHGIEAPEQRFVRGKHREGTVVLRVEQHGNVLFVSVEDDGDGIDTERVRAAAAARGLLPVERLAQLNEQQVQQLIFERGFSTRDAVTASSGRGIGLDVVRSQVAAIDGQVEVQSRPRQGTRIVLTLPMEFGSSPVLAVRAGEQQFGVPLAAIESVQLAKRGSLRATRARMQLMDRDRAIPLVPLTSMLGQAQPGLPNDGRPLLILHAQGKLLALAVDEVLGDQDMVIRPLPAELRTLAAYQGAATLADGELMLVLRSDWLVDQVTQSAGTREVARRALVVDDSLTARALHRTMLEAGGYTVYTAASGAQALELLKQATYDVVVCDIGMAEMDGYAFTAAVRARPETRALPVILVSAHDSDQDRQRGSAVGADGFLSKKECISGRLLSAVSAVMGRRAAS